MTLHEPSPTDASDLLCHLSEENKLNQHSDTEMVSPFTLGLRKLFSGLLSKELQALQQGQPKAFLTQLDAKQNYLEHLKSTISQSIMEHERAKAKNAGLQHQTGTRQLILHFLHETNEEIWRTEDSFIQRIMLVFDCVQDFQRKNLQKGKGQELYYDLLTCMILCLKVEGRIQKCRPMQLHSRVSSLSTHKLLIRHLAPGQASIAWCDAIYLHLEKEILTSLRFKTELVSCSQLVYEIVATYSFHEKCPERQLDTVLLEAQFRSYLCVLDYLPSEYSSATLAAASVLSAVQQVPDELRFALEFFIKTALADSTIKMDLVDQLVDRINEHIRSHDNTAISCKLSQNLSLIPQFSTANNSPDEGYLSQGKACWSDAAADNNCIVYYRGERNAAVVKPFIAEEEESQGSPIGLFSMLENLSDVHGMMNEFVASPYQSQSCHQQLHEEVLQKACVLPSSLYAPSDNNQQKHHTNDRKQILNLNSSKQGLPSPQRLSRQAPRRTPHFINKQGRDKKYTMAQKQKKQAQNLSHLVTIESQQADFSIVNGEELERACNNVA